MKLLIIATLSMLATGNIYANNIEIIGTIKHSINSQTARQQARTPTVEQEISLMKIKLSDAAKQHLSEQATNALSSTKQFSRAASEEIVKQPYAELGMNNVPVLNQGPHGTCVTFAITAALDAALNKGDYISQLCNLQLGNYLEQQGYTPSGWEGTWGRYILSQIDMFGFVNKENQQSAGCGGITEYPSFDYNPSSITPEEFHPISEKIDPESIAWIPVLDVYDAMTERVDTQEILTNVKKSLIAGDRLVFSTLLIDFDLGLMGAVGKNVAKYDTWVLTPEIARDVIWNPAFGAHEMVITGYDDNAIANDDKGRPHRGLLTLRNSWGSGLGDRGNFYMSYDYFKLMVIDVSRIKNLNK